MRVFVLWLNRFFTCLTQCALACLLLLCVTGVRRVSRGRCSQLIRAALNSNAASQLSTATEQLEQAKADLETALEEVAELKEMVEMGGMYESMVEELTEKNLTLGEQVQELTQTVAELEDMREMSEEVRGCARCFVERPCLYHKGCSLSAAVDGAATHQVRDSAADRPRGRDCGGWCTS